MNGQNVLLSLLLLWCCASAKRLFFLGHYQGKAVKYLDSVPSLWYEQTLDHFSPSDTRTWKQRYFVNEKFWKKGGPIFIMIGGEGEANPIWMQEGEWLNYAKKYKALCFLLEHRFYGQSRPTEDMSVKNLRLLSSKQALADLAQFITSMNEEYALSVDTLWVAFGGSYPGSLAAWLRAKYPHLIHAAVSSSGPLLAKVDFKEYFEVVDNALNTQSSGCADVLAAAISQIKDMIGTSKGVQAVEKLFHLCNPLDTTNQLDVASLFETLASNIGGIVQYNGDNRKFEGALGTNITIPVVCGALQDYSIGSPVHRLAFINSLLQNVSQPPGCLSYKYNETISELKNTDWKFSGNGRPWIWQTCTEFGFYQTSNGKSHIFEDYFPVNYFVQMCEDIFGARYNRSFISHAVDDTNTEYGALSIETSRVVFVHGSVDPWHALGITHTLHSQCPAIFIKGSAHCANMYPPDSSDLPQLREARIKIDKYLHQWLSV